MQDETDDTFVRDAPWTDEEMHDMNVWLVGEDDSEHYQYFRNGYYRHVREEEK
jgi:hypothetical protein